MSQQTDDKQTLQKSSGNANAMVVLIALALAGGFADAAAYLLVGSFTGHITGNTVLGAIALGAGKFDAFWLRLAAIVAFSLATAGGILLPRLGLAKKGTLALTLIVEAALVGVAPLARSSHNSHTNLFMLVCLSLALGLQNGTFNQSEGVSVHATYITGDATSLIASLLKKPDAHSPRKSPNKHTTDTVLGVTWSSFAVGALLAGVSVHHFGADALWLLEIPLLVATLSAISSETGNKAQ